MLNAPSQLTEIMVQLLIRSFQEVTCVPVYIVLIAALLLGVPHSLLAASMTTGTAAEQKKVEENQSEKGLPATLPANPVVTRHKSLIGGREISYSATAGQLPIMNDAGETEAQIFFIAYAAGKAAPDSRRPLMFIFNGGPGAASVWLHLGAAGPRRVQMLPDGGMPPAPYRLKDNEFSWLDRADLVFIDPVGTGFSRAAKPETAKKFASVQGDIDSVGRFIRLYLTRYERWNSPLFLAGESYGTFRAAGLSEYLVEHGIALNGIILVSSILNLQTTSFAHGNDLPYQLFLPSYTATAWYHRKLPRHIPADLDQALAAAELWASGDYATALGKGDRLTPGERQAALEKTGRFYRTGPGIYRQSQPAHRRENLCQGTSQGPGGGSRHHGQPVHRREPRSGRIFRF